MKSILNNTEFFLDEKGLNRFSPLNTEYKEAGRSLLPTAFSTKEHGPLFGMAGCENVSFLDTPVVETTITEDGFSSSFTQNDILAETTAKVEGNVLCSHTTLTNTGDSTQTLTHVSSAVLSGLDRPGKMRWYEPGKFLIHYCRYGWSAEAQWCSVTPQDLGIFPGSDKNAGYQTSARLRSIGSWSTGSYYPMVILEDLEVGISYFVELLGPTNWFIEIGHVSDPKDGSFYIEANSADLHSGHFEKVLAPGESYSSVDALWGCVKGGFEEAVASLTAYKRAHTLSHWEKGVPYVCFNDYMNGLHGRLSDARCIPVIDAAASLGAEIYIIDAGWYGGKVDDWTKKKMGFWLPNDALFGEIGLQGVIDHIRSKGMIAGIWTELERFHEGTPLYEMGGYMTDPDDGTPFRVGNCYYADFTKPEVCSFLKDVVDRLYKMGVRYIKNDYNGSTMHGPSVNGSSRGEGNNIYAGAVREFFKDIRASYPDLILENCGSGAMRCDQGMLSLFTLQSITDEEGYLYTPSILAGSGAVMPPEKEGIWSYVYPEHTALKGEILSPDYIRSMEDGEETVFNMVTGMMGCPTLGGRPDLSDEKNLSLAREAVATYKKYRTMVAEGTSVYPTGKVNKGTGKNASYGLYRKEKKDMLLALWRFSESEDTITVDLSKYGNISTATMIYPKDPMGVTYEVAGNILTVQFTKHPSARSFYIQFK